MPVSTQTSPMVTFNDIEAARTPKGGWTKVQLAEWGVPWPPPKGWKQRLIDQGAAPMLEAVTSAGQPVGTMKGLSVDAGPYPIEGMMTKKAYDKIAAGLNDAIAFAEGDQSKGKVSVNLRSLVESVDVAANLNLGATGSAIADCERALKRIAARAEALSGEWERVEIVRSRGPKLEFTGRLLADHEFQTRGRGPTFDMTLEVWETKGGAMIAASYGEPAGGGREIVEATVVKPIYRYDLDTHYQTAALADGDPSQSLDAQAMRFAVMDAFDWTDAARTMATKRLKWSLREEVE